jgi:hypothetical protein
MERGQYQNIGLKGAQAAIAEVSANWEIAIKANEPNRVVLVRKHRARNVNLVVQLFECEGGHYWSVVTIVIGHRVRSADILYEKAKVTVE